MQGENAGSGSVVDRRLVEGDRRRRVGVDAHQGVFDHGVFEGIAFTAQPDTDPLPVEFLKILFQAVALKDHGVFQIALHPELPVGEHVDNAVVVNDGVAHVVERAGHASVHVDARARGQSQRAAVDQQNAVDDVRLGVVPGDLSEVAAHQRQAALAEAAGDVVGVLAPGLQQHPLFVAIGLKNDGVFDDEGAGGERLIGVDGHLHEDVDAVVGSDFHVLYLVSGNAVDVHAELGRFIRSDGNGGDADELAVRIEHLEDFRRRAQLGENRVEAQGIGRKRQLCAGIVHKHPLAPAAHCDKRSNNDNKPENPATHHFFSFN